MRIVLIGYGNELRSDDRFGPEVVRRLGELFHDVSSITTVVATQLLPEHVTLFDGARLVVLFDAAHNEPGSVSVCCICSDRDTAGPLTHQLTADMIVGLAAKTIRRMPRVFLVSAGGYSFDLGEQMSTGMQDIVDEVVESAALRVTRILRLSSSGPRN